MDWNGVDARDLKIPTLAEIRDRKIKSRTIEKNNDENSSVAEVANAFTAWQKKESSSPNPSIQVNPTNGPSSLQKSKEASNSSTDNNDSSRLLPATGEAAKVEDVCPISLAPPSGPSHPSLKEEVGRTVMMKRSHVDVDDNDADAHDCTNLKRVKLEMTTDPPLARPIQKQHEAIDLAEINEDENVETVG